jgi:hypothetical protein
LEEQWPAAVVRLHGTGQRGHVIEIPDEGYQNFKNAC